MGAILYGAGHGNLERLSDVLRVAVTMREGSGAEDMDGSLITQIQGHALHTEPSPILSPRCTSSYPTLSQGVSWCPKGVMAQDNGSTPEQSPGSTLQSLTPTLCLFLK